MRLADPIAVDLRDFVLSGRFDVVEPGQTRAWLRENFADPDQADVPGVRGAAIWRYGNVELHFRDDTLWMIYTDAVGRLDGGPALAIDPWILDGAPGLLEVVAVLVELGVAFQVTPRPSVWLVELRVLASGVKFVFSSESDPRLPLTAVSRAE